MDIITKNEISKTTKKEASQWVSRLSYGLSTEEKQSLIAWINSCPANHQAFAQLTQKEDTSFITNELKGVFALEKKSNKPSSLFTGIALTLSLLIVFFAFYNLLNGTYSSSPKNYQQLTFQQSYQTMIGEQTSYLLPDGSTLLLNTNSIVEIHFSEQRRLINLLKGEANFAVAKDKTRPFTVNVAEQSFTALGTAFNIYKENNENMAITVTEGTVLVAKAAALDMQFKQQNDNEIVLENLPGVVVTDGQQAIVTNNKTSDAFPLSQDDITKSIAWQQGVLIFDGEALTEVLKQVSRYSNTHFEIADQQLAQLKISGYFKAGDINGLLSALADNFDISYHKPSYHSVILDRSNRQKS